MRIIQFIHDGPEHKPTHGNFKDWNYGKHQRKFLKVKGEYVKEPNSSLKAIKDNLLFWAEWEPQSTVIKNLTNYGNLPKYLYEPYFDLSAPLKKGKLSKSGDVCAIGNRQNTDPFIFGNNLYYFVCKQKRKTGYTSLAKLNPGDIILFGSKLNGNFILDTLFVVSDEKPITYIPENVEFSIKPNVSNEYYNLNFVSAFWKNIKKGQTSALFSTGFNLYKGATIEKPYKGMFSFVPVKLDDNKNIGFERPIIFPSNYINPDKMQGYKITENVDLNRSKDFWLDIASQVISKKDIFLGTKFEMPKNTTPSNFDTQNLIENTEE